MGSHEPSSGMDIFHTYKGEHRNLREWAVLWLEKHGKKADNNETIRRAVKILKQRIASRGFPLAIETPPKETTRRRHIGKIVDPYQGPIVRRPSKRRSLGEIRQILHDNPSELFRGLPISVEVINARFF